MKITRHTASDMRQALRAVRAELGADAVILASRRTPSGVEVTAAMDFDADNLQQGPSASAPVAAPAAQKPTAAVAEATPPPTMFESHTLEPPPTVARSAPTVFPASAESMEHELKSLRRMLETQLAHLSWSDLTRRAPIHAQLLRELTEVGLTPDLAAQFVTHIPITAELTEARRLAIASMAQQVLVTGDRWLQEGGTIALIGPTGVGKTTTLAKLAVRWVLQHGARDLALVAGDSQRLGAQEQLQALGELLGAEVYPLQDLSELSALLARLGGRRFVLIDTPGCSQRDAQLAGRLATLGATGCDLQVALVLAASTQAAAIAEVVARFAAAQATSCVLTKVDEAASLGGALSVLMRSRLPISYVSEGQRVPEDLRPARALELVSQAVQLAQTSGATADEDLLKRRFGDVAHALA